MTPRPSTARDAAPEPDPAAQELVSRVLDALLREDVVGLRSRSVPVERADGRWLRLPVGGTEGGALLLPVTEDGFQSDYAARAPFLVLEGGSGAEEARLTSYGAILGALRALADPLDRPGFDAFAEECGEALAARRLHDLTREEVTARLRDTYGPDPARWTGLAGGLAHDTLAARHDHPVHPTSRARAGLGDAELRAHAPEFHPRFALRWLAVPRDALTVAGGAEALPGCWPTLADLGLPELDAGHLALPVHPLALGPPLEEALRATGLQGRAVLAQQPYLEVVPTLSTRTVAVADEPELHLKLPLATATLGQRNRRTIKPGTLVDGAACQRLLATVTTRAPRFRTTVLHADETVYAHAGHELLAVLCRRCPPGLDGAVITPLAALSAEAPDGALVSDHLADRFFDGDPVALFDAWLAPLLDWQTTLLGHGVALESHQQNVSLVLDRDVASGATRTRLLLKDNDGPRLNTARLRASLGDAALDPAAFTDARILTDGDGPVVDLFTTITLHLCAAAPAFALARHGRARLPRLLGLIRDRLGAAADRLGTGPGEPGALLRTRVLDAPQLPIKAMVTAGTLLTKERSGAADINKHYTTGPNYLRSVPPHPRTSRIRWSR